MRSELLFAISPCGTTTTDDRYRDDPYRVQVYCQDNIMIHKVNFYSMRNYSGATSLLAGSEGLEKKPSRYLFNLIKLHQEACENKNRHYFFSPKEARWSVYPF